MGKKLSSPEVEKENAKQKPNGEKQQMSSKQINQPNVLRYRNLRVADDNNKQINPMLMKRHNGHNRSFVQNWLQNKFRPFTSFLQA